MSNVVDVGGSVGPSSEHEVRRARMSIDLNDCPTRLNSLLASVAISVAAAEAAGPNGRRRARMTSAAKVVKPLRPLSGLPIMVMWFRGKREFVVVCLSGFFRYPSPNDCVHLPGRAARNVMSPKTEMPARSSATAGSAELPRLLPFRLQIVPVHDLFHHLAFAQFDANCVSLGAAEIEPYVSRLRQVFLR